MVSASDASFATQRAANRMRAVEASGLPRLISQVFQRRSRKSTRWFREAADVARKARRLCFAFQTLDLPFLIGFVVPH